MAFWRLSSSLGCSTVLWNWLASFVIVWCSCWNMVSIVSSGTACWVMVLESCDSMVVSSAIAVVNGMFLLMSPSRSVWMDLSVACSIAFLYLGSVG